MWRGRDRMVQRPRILSRHEGSSGLSVSLRRVLLSEWTLGTVMAGVVLLAGGNLLARLTAAGIPLGSTPSPEELADALLWSGSLAIEDVEVDHDPWFGSPEVYITLVGGATDAQARDVWCEHILPTGVRRAMVVVSRGLDSGEWPPPTDCSDPDDIPAFRPVPS